MTTAALQWRPTNAPLASSRTDDIWFLDPSTGWAVNSNGHILMTDNGGATWTKQFSADVYLRCVGFANRNIGWVGTLSSSRRLFHTNDGGNTWKRVDNLPATAPVFVCGMSVVNESVVYASGTNDPAEAPRMMKTVDRGATWTAWEMSEHASLLVDCFFTTPDRGWVVGGKASVPNPSRDDVKPVVLFTEDGGLTWTNRVADLQDEFPFGEWGWKIFFLSDLIGFVSLENFTAAAILKTTDGGVSWSRHQINDPQGNANLEGIGFADANHGWVGGWGDESFLSGLSSESLDGGNNWQDANQIGRFINRFRFFGNPATLGYASGRTVYKYSSEPVVPHSLDAAPSAKFLSSSDPQTTQGPVDIVYTVPQGAQYLNIGIWDRFGKYVRKLVDQREPRPGTHTQIWNLADDSGQIVSRGPFIYRISIDDDAESRIIVVNP